MNGVHDMGGQQNMGPVVYEKDEPSSLSSDSLDWMRQAFKGQFNSIDRDKLDQMDSGTSLFEQTETTRTTKLLR